jgi:integrase
MPVVRHEAQGRRERPTLLSQHPEVRLEAVSDYVSQGDAEARLGISRTLFEANLRPQLTEYPIGARGVRFKWAEIEQVMAESAASQQEGAAMFFRRTITDALEHAWRVKWSKAPGARKKDQLRKVVERDVGAKRIDRFDYNELEAWILKMQSADQAVATIKSKVSCVMTALKLVQPKGWVKALPLVPPIGEPDNAKIRWLSPAEEQTLIDACGCQRAVIETVMQDVIRFLVDTGARVGELLKVREDSLSTRGSLTYVEFLGRKAGDDLRIPLTARARDAIERLLANRYWQKRIRGSRDHAKRHTSAQNWLTHRFAEIRAHAKMPDVTAHTLRHTCASRLVQRGVSIYKVQKFLGHSDIRMTERYAHLAPSDLDDAARALEPPTPVTNIGDYRK